MRRPTATACFTSPLGTIIVHADDAHLLGLKIAPNDPGSAGPGDISHSILAQAIAQLSDWFSGARQEFDLPLAPLQQPEAARLRAGIAAIPFGVNIIRRETAPEQKPGCLIMNMPNFPKRKGRD